MTRGHADPSATIFRLNNNLWLDGLDDRIKIVLKMTLNVKNLLLSINASSIPNIKQVIYFGVTISSNLSIGSRLD